MYTVSQLAKRCGVTPDTVRHYTMKGLLRPSRDPANGYRRYGAADLHRMRFIHQAKRLGYTLKEVEEIITLAGQGRSPCPRVRDIIAARIVDNRRRLDELNALQARMEQALSSWRTLPDGVPDGLTVCHLIEGTAAD
ncbi:MAG TPA: MerR family transcriptional regulator [Gammaproteobacteria bacterium]|nr:MerR family transcriptional regulator [Gammaproteobacteria bacterium]